MKAGDVVVITTHQGLENRYGCLGVLRGSCRPDAWDLFTKEPSEQGYLSTYHVSQFEVIDEDMEPIEEPVVPIEAVREIQRRSLS